MYVNFYIYLVLLQFYNTNSTQTHLSSTPFSFLPHAKLMRPNYLHVNLSFIRFKNMMKIFYDHVAFCEMFTPTCRHTNDEMLQLSKTHVGNLFQYYKSGISHKVYLRWKKWLWFYQVRNQGIDGSYKHMTSGYIDPNCWYFNHSTLINQF